MQRRLIEAEIEKLKKARDIMQDILLPMYSDSDQFWRQAVKLLTDKVENGTSDGKPWVEPELTDKDACVWPRLLVMVRDRDSGPWQGPVHFVAKTDCELCFVTEHDRRGVVCWRYARRATAEEIKGAKL